MAHFKLTEEQAREFERDGYLFVPGFLDSEEQDLVFRAAKGDSSMETKAVGRKDASGKVSRLTLWNHPSNDIFGMIARSRRMVDTMEVMLGGEVYHYHSKLMLKEPKVGGAWEWHQDYGYWYKNGCLFPYMASCMIALDAATRENGCLQVLRGSHHMGRVEHGEFGEQVGADPERVEEAKKRLELVYCEMEPGTALFFHGNLLHTSAPNTSENPRWTLICCYNAARNNPYKEHHHPQYTPLERVDDGAIKEAGQQALDTDRAYMPTGG
jgi:ectoine hydroxylase-related dioxygenase (phytanoyl-CoA dioxygenase family)